MHEGHLETEQPRPGLLVDQLGARAGKLGEGHTEILDLVRDVMHAGPALGEEPPHRGVVPQGLEQLHAAVADAERSRAHALLLHRRLMLDMRSEEALVRAQSAVEILDRDTDMMDPPRLHAGDAIGGLRLRRAER